MERYVNGVHLPVQAQQELRELVRARAALWEQEGREPREEELAEALGVQAERVRRLQTASRSLLSLDEPLYGEGEGGSLADLLADEGPSVEEQAEQVLRAEALRAIMRQILTPREDLVLQLRFGLSQQPAASLEQVGRRLGLTRERVRQIESRARHKLAHSSQVQALYQGKTAKFGFDLALRIRDL